jgi:hypothetical protein
MEHADEFILTALTLILAKQIQAEALASGREITSDPVDQATHLIQQQRIPSHTGLVFAISRRH